MYFFRRSPILYGVVQPSFATCITPVTLLLSSSSVTHIKSSSTVPEFHPPPSPTNLLKLHGLTPVESSSVASGGNPPKRKFLRFHPPTPRRGGIREGGLKVSILTSIFFSLSSEETGCRGLNIKYFSFFLDPIMFSDQTFVQE